MVYYIIILLQCIFALFYYGCKKEPLIVPPEEPKPEIRLTLQDTTCTEAWLQLQFKNLLPPHNYKIYRDSTLAFAGTLFTNDTTFIDTTLLPQRQYGYKLLRVENNVAKDSSSILQITTMDTTSHEFIFTIDTLGGYGSVLRDVAIIDENNIWAVGEIWMPDGKVYNAVRWDGTRWNLEEVKYNFNGQTGVAALYSVFIFSINDLWVGGSTSYHWDGTKWTEYDVSGVFPSYINKMWGTNSQDMYLIGSNGAIAHFDGISWKKMESSTDVNLTDIYGTADGKQVWTCGYFSNKRGTFLIKKEDNLTWRVVYDGSVNETIVKHDSISGAMATIFVPKIKRLFIGTHTGMYLTTENTNGEAKRLSFSSDYFPGFPTRLRGNAINDVVLCGAFSFIGHYNGYTWKNYSELRTEDIALRSLDQKKNTLVAVGNLQDAINGRGIIIRGQR